LVALLVRQRLRVAANGAVAVRSHFTRRGVNVPRFAQASLRGSPDRKDRRAGFFRLVTADDRRVVSRDFKAAGFRVPSLRKLESMICDSIVDSVFGQSVEPDGWDEVRSTVGDVVLIGSQP
jgi:hypothetical protein